MDPTTGTMPATSAPAPMGLFARLFGVIFSPYQAYAAVAARPRWFGALAIGTLLTCAALFWMYSSEGVQRATLEQQVSVLEGFGVTVTDEAYDQMESRMAWSPYTTAASVLFGAPFVNALLAGLLLGVFNAIMGGNATFRQVFAIVSHAGFVSAVAQVISAPINYAREQITSPMRLNALLPMFDEESAVGMFLGSIDLFIVWWLLSLAIGVGVLYKRRTGPIMTGFLGVFLAIVAVVTGIRLAF